MACHLHYLISGGSTRNARYASKSAKHKQHKSSRFKAVGAVGFSDSWIRDCWCHIFHFFPIFQATACPSYFICAGHDFCWRWQGSLFCSVVKCLLETLIFVYFLVFFSSSHYLVPAPVWIFSLYTSVVSRVSKTNQQNLVLYKRCCSNEQRVIFCFHIYITACEFCKHKN